MKSDLPRWAELGLADPTVPRDLDRAQTADLLAYALVLPEADDPVIGIVDAVALELRALSRNVDDPTRDVLWMLSRRLDVATLLLRRTDVCTSTPPEFDLDDEETKDADPTNDNGEPEGHAS